MYKPKTDQKIILTKYKETIKSQYISPQDFPYISP